MPSGGEIRAGGAYVELYTRDERVNTGLAKTKARIGSWAKDINRVSGAIGGERVPGFGMVSQLMKAGPAGLFGGAVAGTAALYMMQIKSIADMSAEAQKADMTFEQFSKVQGKYVGVTNEQAAASAILTSRIGTLGKTLRDTAAATAAAPLTWIVGYDEIYKRLEKEAAVRQRIVQITKEQEAAEQRKKDNARDAAEAAAATANMRGIGDAARNRAYELRGGDADQLRIADAKKKNASEIAAIEKRIGDARKTWQGTKMDDAAWDVYHAAQKAASTDEERRKAELLHPARRKVAQMDEIRAMEAEKKRLQREAQQAEDYANRQIADRNKADAEDKAKKESERIKKETDEALDRGRQQWKDEQKRAQDEIEGATPAGKYQQRYRELMEQEAQGLITAAQRDQGIKQAQDALANSMMKEAGRTSTAGTFSGEAAALVGGSGISVKLDKQTTILEQIRDAIKDGGSTFGP